MNIRIRHILSAISLLCCMAAYAQSSEYKYSDNKYTPDNKYPDVPLYDSSPAKKFMDIKLQFTVGGSSTVNNYKSVIPGLSDMQFSPAAMFRTGIDVAFNIKKSLAIGTGLEFGIHNSRFALSLVDANTSSINSVYSKNHYYDLNVPVYVSFRLNLGRRIQGLIDVGGYFAYGLGGKVKSSGYTSGQNSLGQPVINHLYYKKDYFDDNISVINSVKRFDYGPRLSAGILIRQHYSFNWVFQMSTPNLAINHNVLDVKYRHLTLGFEVGYVF